MERANFFQGQRQGHSFCVKLQGASNVQGHVMRRLTDVKRTK